MEAPKRGSDEWVREKTNLVVTEAAIHISDVLDALLEAKATTGSAKLSIDTRHCQIDVNDAIRLIREFIEQQYGLTPAMYVLDYSYERDYDVNRDFFKLEVVFTLAEN